MNQLALSDLENKILDILYWKFTVKDSRLPCQTAKQSLIGLGLVSSTHGKSHLTEAGVGYVEAYLIKDSLRN